MKKFPRTAVPACCAALLAAVAAASPHWMLMARHGECAPIASLERKIHDLGEVRDPAAFVQQMRSRGYAVSTKEVASGAVEVDVPAKGLALVFVTADKCGPAARR